MAKIVWGITGSGDKIDEVYDVMLNLQRKIDIRIKVIVSKAGEQVLRWYKLWGRLSESFDNVLVETNANMPFIAGPLQIGKYDILVVAPLTANSTAKIAHGIADTLITNAVAQTVHCKLYEVGHRSLVRPENGTGLLREEPSQVCHIPQRSMSY